MSGINEQWSVIYTFKSTVGWSVDWRGNSSQYPASMIAANVGQKPTGQNPTH